VTKLRNVSGFRELGTLFSVGVIGGLKDRQLLECYLSRRGDNGERAFAALVERHGPMVLRVCRGYLRDDNDVQDAFQATFVVLARQRVGTLWVRDSIGPWLYSVACRIAARARSDMARRRRHERRAAERLSLTVNDRSWDDVGSLVDEEVDASRALPIRARALLPRRTDP
jgi:RNA polymerase sigma factor (sigma-70 family)